jgi:hypothetical protein
MSDLDFSSPGTGKTFSKVGKSPGPNSLAITSLVIGGLSFLTALFPCTAIIALPISLLGILLGFVGFFCSGGKGFAIGGLGLNLFAVVIAAIWLTAAGAVIVLPEIGRQNQGKGKFELPTRTKK